MTKIKRALAALAASAMMFSMSGCTDTRYVMTTNSGDKINAGVYIYNIYSDMNYEMTMAYYTSGAATIDLESDKDGQPLREYLTENARKNTKELAAVTAQFEKLGLTLSDEELKAISDNVTSVWDSSGDLFEEEGISKDSIRQVYKSQSMRTKLFDYYYGAEGVEAVSDDDLKKYVEDNFIRYKAIRIMKADAEDEAEKESANKENEATRDEFLAKAEGVSFDDFDAIIDEYSAYAQAQQEAETSAAEDTTAADTVGPVLADETETAVDAPEDNGGLEEEAVLDENAESVSADELDSQAEENADTAETSDDAEADTAAAETAETEEKPTLNPNETLFNYGGMDDSTKETITGKLAEFINGMENDKATAYEDDSFYYILIKGDVAGASEIYASNNHDNLVQTMKSDDFQAKIDSWVEELGITENSDAIKRYTPQAIYDKQDAFYKK